MTQIPVDVITLVVTSIGTLSLLVVVTTWALVRSALSPSRSRRH